MAESSPEDEIKPAAGAGSAEERCPICLEDYEDKAFIDACFHAFCFGCIVKAVEMTTGRCPMCKATFDTVIHNVRAIDDYDRYKVQPKPTPPPLSSAMQEEAFRMFRGYRTTRLPGQPRSQEPSASASALDNRSRLTDSSATAPSSGSTSTSSSQQGLLPDPSKSSHTRKKTISTQSRRQQSRKPAALERRRAVYSTGLRALPIETSDSRRIRVRDISASFFRSNPASTHRLFPWLTREFKILVGDEHVEFMLQLMQSLIDKIDLESGEFGSHLEPFLHEKTQHFMHELVSFAKSPYDMIAYDNRVRYDWPETHPQAAREQVGGGEITNAGSQPGPSGIQQRVLEELMLSRWDSSPPLHHSGSRGGSHSPTTIVIQDSSDSEADLNPGHTPSPSSYSQLPTNATAETAVEQSEDPALLSTVTTPSQGDTQTSANPGAAVPSNLISSEQPPASLTTISDQRDAQIPSALTENPEQLTLTTASAEAVTSNECKQSAKSSHDTMTDEPLVTVDSCPEVSSSSSAAVISEKPVLMDDQVSSTSENLESIYQPASTSATAINQPRSDVLPREEATPLLQSCDQVQDEDDDFEISLYAEDGGASLGEGSTPNSEILKKSRKDRDKSSRVSELRKKKSHHHDDDEYSRKKGHSKSGSRHSESKSSASSGSGRRGHESSSSRRHKDRGKHHRESRHRRSRSRSHSRSRSYRSHRHDSTDREYSSRSRHRSRSREREYSHKHRSRSRSVSRPRYSKSHRSKSRSVSRPRYSKSHRSRSRSVSRPRYSRSCSFEDGDTFSRMKSTVVAKNRDKDTKEHRYHSERHRRERSESQSPHRRVSSHYRGDHDYERMSAGYDGGEHRSHGRLYSDEVWNEQQHSQQSSGKSVRHSTQASSHSSQGKRAEKKQKSKAETKLLALELNEVDKQIQDNKKELLKSMLRKERLELLQKNLHGGESSVADASAMLRRSTDGAGVKTTSEMEKELELLNRAITDGKKQLLRVMKKTEEEQTEMNN